MAPNWKISTSSCLSQPVRNICIQSRVETLINLHSFADFLEIWWKICTTFGWKLDGKLPNAIFLFCDWDIIDNQTFYIVLEKWQKTANTVCIPRWRSRCCCNSDEKPIIACSLARSVWRAELIGPAWNRNRLPWSEMPTTTVSEVLQGMLLR